MAKTHSNSTDEDLVLSIRRSDPKAFRVLYDRYHDPIFRFLWVRLRSADPASDLTQEVFVRIWENRGRLNPEKSVKACLYRIAHNLAVDHHRTWVRQKAYQEDVSEHDNGHFEWKSDLKIDYENAMKQLPESVRLTFHLNRFEGMKYQEISEMLDVSVKTIEYRMSRALGLLRALYREP